MNLHMLARSLSALLCGTAIKLENIDDQAARRIRGAQIEAVVQLVPLTMTINVFNAAIVGGVFWDSGATNLFLVVWGGLIALAAIAGFWSWQRTRQNRPTGASLRALKRAALHATVLALVWGAAPLVLFPGADLTRQLVLACLIAGMISGGAFCLSTVPNAGLAYTWTLVLLSAASLLLARHQVFAVVALLLLLYAVFVSHNLVAHGNLFVSHLRDELKLEAQRELIGLLLNDFQEHASDWRWETDANGALLRVSDRFAETAGKTPSELQGARFADLIGGPQEYRPAEIVDILQRIAARGAFRDVTVPVRVGASRRYWLLSAKPVFDNAGGFTGYHGVGADVTEKRLTEARILRLARYDTVTELPNRASFQEEVDRALVEARANGQSVALLCLDLDQFKSVNDTLGHPVGDALLKQAGKRIRACARNRDIVARLGGDEFAVLQISPELPTATMMLSRQIIDAFKTPFKLEHGDIATSTSIGIAVAPADGWAADPLMKKADMALYAAKADGAATYRFFEPEMEAWAQRRRALQVGLRSALNNGEFHLVFQPMVDLRTGAVAGCEALLRWHSAAWGSVSPAEFIPVAEATGTIEPIGEWALRQAVNTARQWPEHTMVAVNLSAVQFKNQRLLATVIAALADSGLPPHRLELEVTESIFIDGNAHAEEMLKNLRTLGVRTSLDDFGTGYSSLSYLRRFHFDKIKIDKSFIDDVAARDESLAIIRAIVALADALGMSTTAEGVESLAQVGKLREAGCSQIQGYVFSPPRPAAEIPALLARRLEGYEPGGMAAPTGKVRARARRSGFRV